MREDYQDRWPRYRENWIEGNPPDSTWMEDGQLEFYCQGENCGEQD